MSSLDKLALAQAEIGRSFSPEESQRLASYATPTLKSVFTLPKLLPFVDDAKRLAPGATSVEKAAFQQAGKNVEKAANAEAQKAKLAALKARSAEIEAAKAAGKPVPAAAGAPAKPRPPALPDATTPLLLVLRIHRHAHADDERRARAARLLGWVSAVPGPLGEAVQKIIAYPAD